MEILETFQDVAVPSRNVRSEDNELVHPRHAKRYAAEYAKLAGRAIRRQPDLIEAFYAVNDSAAYAGFKSMPNRHPDFAAFTGRKDIQFITLRRRDVASTVASFLRAGDTGSWRRHGEDPDASWRFDPKAHGEAARSNLAYVRSSHEQLGAIPGAIHLFYEDLCNPEYANPELDEFFGRPVRLLNPKPPTAGSSYVENWDEFLKFIEAADKARAKGGRARPAAPGKARAAPAAGQRAASTRPSPARLRNGRVFYAWELGQDLGHLLRFLAPALKLRERGHDVVFAVRDLSNAEATLGHRGFPLMQAPIWIANVAGLPKMTVSYAEIALRYGFISYPGLKALVKAWRELFRYVRPGLVLTDHSPTALLAARSLGIRHAPIGSGFFNPPLTNPLPSMRYWDKVPPQRIAQPDQMATRVANQVLADMGGTPLRSMADLFRADENFLCTFPELDHYPNREGARYWGPTFEMDQGVEMAWPQGEGRRIFAYIKPRHRDFVRMLEALRDSGHQVLAYAPGIDKDNLEKFRSERLLISREPLKLKSMIEGCDLVICHAGPGTMTVALLAGVPLLLLPTQLEQAMGARRVAGLGAAIVVMRGNRPDEKAAKEGESAKPEPETDYSRLIHDLLSHDKYRKAAGAFAKKYARFSQASQSRDIASRIEQLLQR
jgi:UDP:flavonoid glycosyltransferase YjiC (YdhE family)